MAVISRRVLKFIQLLMVSVIVVAMVLSYYAYRKHTEYWVREVEWVEFLEDQARRAQTTLPHRKRRPEIVILNNPLIVVNKSMSEWEVEENFFRYIESKDVKCMDSQRLGSQHEGGYNVCLSPPYGLRAPCYVFSFGIHGDWNFDDSVSQMYKCTVYAYDASEQNVQQDRSKLIHFEQTGLGGRDGHIKRGAVKTLAMYLRDRQLANTPISYLKFDIEFGEWTALQQMVRDGSLKNVKQIGFEMHTKEFKKQTSFKRDYINMYEILRGLERLGFRRYNHRNNPFGAFTSTLTNKPRSCCYELYYVNMNFISSLGNVDTTT